MIIIDIKEIYKQVEIGDYIGYYKNYSSHGPKKDDVIISEVIEIEECNICREGYICNKMIFTDDTENNSGCFIYPDEECAIKSLIKKEDFITEEDMKI